MCAELMAFSVFGIIVENGPSDPPQPPNPLYPRVVNRSLEYFRWKCLVCECHVLLAETHRAPRPNPHCWLRHLASNIQYNGY